MDLTQHSLPTSVLLLTLHDTFARGHRVFFVSVLCVFLAVVSNAVDTMWFLRSAPKVNVVRYSNKRGQTTGVTVNLIKAKRMRVNGGVVVAMTLSR